MPTTAYPGLLSGSSLGAPLLNVIPLLTSGRLFFVSSVSGSNNNVGDDPLRPRASIAATIAKCRPSLGDQIWCLPHHAETVSAAAGIAVNVAGVSLFGMGAGASRPTITFTTAIGASLDISVANVMMRNFRFICGIDAQTAMVNVTGADVAFLDNEFVTNTGTIGAVLGILTAATATRLRIERNMFTGPAVNTGTTTTAQVKHEVGIDYVIQDNYFNGKMTQAILNATTVLGGFIHNNRFVVYTGTVAITMAAASTPFITNNRINVPSGTAPIVAAAGFVAGNIYSAAAGVTAGTASTI